MEEKKYKSIVVIWGGILLILQALILIDAIGLRPQIYNQLNKLTISFIATGMIIVIITYILLSLDKKKAGLILGIIIGLLYIMTLNVINIIAGVCFIIYCVVMLKSIGKEPKKEQNEA